MPNIERFHHSNNCSTIVDFKMDEIIPEEKLKF